MEITFLGLLILLLVIIITTWLILTYNNFQSFLIRINEAEANIDSILRKRYDLLNKAVSVLKPHLKKEEFLKDLSKLKNKKTTNFELDRQLYQFINELNALKENHSEIKTLDGLIKIDANLNNTEIEITGSRKYYNDIITDYNKLVKSFPSNIIGFIYKYKYRNFYDDKDMTDDVKNDFKL